MMSPALRETFAPLRLMMQDRLAVVGLCVLGLIFAMAVFAPLIAPQDPFAINEDEDGSVLKKSDEGWVLQPSLGHVALNDTASRPGEDLIVGREGSLWTRKNGSWSRAVLPTEVDLFGVDVTASGVALIVGEQGTLLLREGEKWQSLQSLAPVTLRSVSWLADDTALIVGDEETLWLFALADRSLTPVTSPINRGMSLRGVERDVDGTALVVGERGLALQYDPVSQQAKMLRLGTSRDLNDVHVSPAGIALAIGERGTLLRRDGPNADWVSDRTPDRRALMSGWIGDDGTGYAVGRNGIVMELVRGGEWTLANTESERHLRAILVTDADALALGSDRFVIRFSPPSPQHWFGTDHLGRDLFSRNIHGARIALLVGFLGAFLVMLIGTNVGLIAGYYGGRTDSILMRTVDVMYGIPFEPFALILVLLFKPSLLIVILAVSLLTWRTTARLIRAQVLSLRERPFVKAARVAGASDLRIMYLHILPNVMPLVFLELAITVGVSIIAEATLSFLGLGPPQSVSWGGILHDARLSGAWRTAWWWNLPPGLFIMSTVLSVFFISRSLEVVANPRLRART
ncbi:ABC transporter permease subunit [Nitratireductor aquibiodomus]|uniref:ABC transporter permease subunit n=1 Tax=Nitratireductor aquibiodomus TaxID=204799 RepID=UPI0019D37F03|nr:ABC transporter permease subunit [Nitratireductor aquibiodomus]MBN7760627.1 ABC transporter permease subunit [Nitratireductor aquibiodomus]